MKLHKKLQIDMKRLNVVQDDSLSDYQIFSGLHV